MTFDREGSAPFHFNPDKLGTVQPKLAEAEGYTLPADELSLIFGIQPNYFGKLPKRMVVPVLEGNWYTENWYRTSGYLYIVEPEAWVPRVSHGRTLPTSEFKTSHTKEWERNTETSFTAGTSAEISLQGGGTYFGVTASVSSTSDISFRHSDSTTTKESLETKGTSGNVPIHQLFLFPTLKCKVIKKQRIDYTINDSSQELKWTGDSYNAGYWDERWVADKRLSAVRKLALHPVPMEGNGLGHKAYVLPVPHLTEDNDLEVTTIISRQGWVDWYEYDIPWEDVDETISLAVPDNGVAFPPMTTWTTLVSLPIL